MSPFRHPAEPHTIDGVMRAIGDQLVTAPDTQTNAPGEEATSSPGDPLHPAAAAPPPEAIPQQAIPQASSAPRPIVQDGSRTARLQAGLELLRQRVALDPHYRIHSHRPVIGRAFDAVRRVILWGAKPYVDAIREKQEAFNETTLQALREVSAQLEMIRAEHEAQTAHAREAISSLETRLAGEMQTAREQLNEAGARLAETEQNLDQRLAPLEQWQAWHGRDFDLDTFFQSVPRQQRLDTLDTTRGPYDDIRHRQSRYAQMFKGLPGQVLDIGCGRGEFVNMMRYEGVEVWGCDTDAEMIEIATREGATARVMDGLSALRSVPDASLGGVFAAQVVEHLFPGVLLELLRLIRQKLAPGGRVVLETLNPATLGVLAKSYYRDLDHKQPIHPQYMKLLMELAGFEQVELELTAPFGPEDRLAELPAAEELGVSTAGREALQQRLDQLNGLLYGPQDYYVSARQPAEPAAAS